MTKSLPGAADLHPGANGTPIGWIRRMQSAVTLAGARVTPWIPTKAKRALLGGRSVVVDGNTLDPTVQWMLSGQRLVGVRGLAVDDDPIASRAQMRDTCLAMPGPQIHVSTSDISLPGPAGTIPARHYRPPSGAAAPLLVFYHGGGWTIGDLDTHDALCRLTCRDADIHVLSIDYRLAPEHPAPAAVEDAYAAFEWAYDHAEDLGALRGQVAVGGDSAGGNLSAVVCQLARDNAGSTGGPAPILQWLLYPRTDFTSQTRSMGLFADGFLLTKRDMDWFHAQYLRGSGMDPSDPRLSPALATSLSGLPPALIAVAGFDPLRDEGESYAKALQAAGVDVDLRYMGSLTHGFVNLFQLGGASAVATNELISALRAHLSRV
ncbi:alpha/beta hydrolase [Mycobacterium spongiae]|uniref:Alpha/beta hydrolase fold domain-containing protein n=1 Tax=Mycobacterium spongiae TaxID=886343 RepID=A0A975PW82_9MYCO|nr:alpha/beta hydrolase [Mycobacterium spongiae]QUR66880.1 alpha/beta hydrolase fold domain-containing protein [Mycobacterium spongiae]